MSSEVETSVILNRNDLINRLNLRWDDLGADVLPYR
jgi:hypothetical protein